MLGVLSNIGDGAAGVAAPTDPTFVMLGVGGALDDTDWEPVSLTTGGTTATLRMASRA